MVQPFAIPSIFNSIKQRYAAKEMTLTEVAAELHRCGHTNFVDLCRAAEVLGVVDIVCDFTDRRGSRREFYVRLCEGGQRFRLACCPTIRTIRSGETFEQAVRREVSGVTQRTWPTAPEYWIDDVAAELTASAS